MRIRRPLRALAAVAPRRAAHTATTTTAAASTANADEVAHFSRLAAHWWDEHGEFRLLHRMNPVRVQFLLQKLREVRDAEDDRGHGPEHEHEHDAARGPSLAGLDVLDVGCGGGLMSESLARLGAHTLGIDASPANIAIASAHAAADPALSRSGLLHYRPAAAEDLLPEPQRFDIVCAMEVLEHVDHPAAFLRACDALLKPGGHILLSTIARTPLSYLLTIFMAEKVMRLVTPGTHSYDKFVNPSELLSFFRDDMQWFDGDNPGRLRAEVRGMMYLPWQAQWKLAGREQFSAADCNYIFWARKPSA